MSGVAVPELLKSFLEKVSADGLQVVGADRAAGNAARSSDSLHVSAAASGTSSAQEHDLPGQFGATKSAHGFSDVAPGRSVGTMNVNSVELETAKQHEVPCRPRTGECEPLAVRGPREVLDTMVVFREVRQLVGRGAIQFLHPDVGA